MSILSVLRITAGSMLAGFVFAQTAAPPAVKPKPAAAKPKPAVAKPALEPGLYATMTTSMGPILIKFFETESPITVKNFTDLAQGNKEWTDPKTNGRVKRPLYDGLIFHRVIPGFMIQGGDPTGTGMGGTDVIPDEFHPSLQFDRPGRVAMANTGSPTTGSCQFFITDAPTTHLNGRHTIFGQVVDGQAVVDKIVHVARNEEDRPNTPVRIVRVSVRRVGASGNRPAAAKPKPAASKPKPSVAKPSVAKPKTTP